MTEIIDCEQGSEEWFRVRMGIPTASEFDAVMAKGKGDAPSKTRATYMYKLAGEIITGESMYRHTNDHMERGKTMEDEAREMYSFLSGNEPQCVGFIRNGIAGCSPDSLINANGGLEIKTKLPHLQIEALLDGQVPAEHVKQIQGQIWIAELEWVDFFSYCPKMPPLLVRAYRDEKIIQSIITAVEAFNSELNELVNKLQTFGSSENQEIAASRR